MSYDELTLGDLPYEPEGPCCSPNPDVAGEICGDFEDHEGGHGCWFTPPPGALVTKAVTPTP